MKMRMGMLAAAIFLAGCGTVSGPLPSGPGALSPLVDAGVISAETREKARQVQAQAKATCDLVMPLATAVSVLAGSVGASATAIANGVCLAATSTPLADGGKRVVYYNGVRIKGTLKGRKLQ